MLQKHRLQYTLNSTCQENLRFRFPMVLAGPSFNSYITECYASSPAQAHLPIGIPQAIEPFAAQILGIRYRQVAGLEQQCLGGYSIHIKGR